MTAKEYLNQIRQLKRRCETLARKRAELETEAAGVKAITYDRDRVQTSPENHLEKIMARLDEISRKYARNIARYYAEVEKREKQIAGLDRADYAEILRLRYIDADNDGQQLSLEWIACTMHISYSRARHLHGEALEAFRRKYL